MTDNNKRRPIVIDLEARVQDPLKTPAEAPPVPEPIPAGARPAMERVTGFAARKPSPLLRWFGAGLMGLLGFMLSVALWDFAADLLMRNIWLGRTALVFLAITAGALLLIALQELAALARLRKIDGLRIMAENLGAEVDLATVQTFTGKLEKLYLGRADQSWGLSALADHKAEMLDPEDLLAVTETTLLAPLDKQALQQVENAARQVATATAIVPLALVDIFVALTANIRMIRQIAQIYGGRSGSLGSWRLIRAVATHLVATGAVAVGDDLIGSVAGGGVLSKLSRRFGEGMINGALTARVGIAAMEVCRPMPFAAEPRPRVTDVIKQALTGLFS